jgi:hypothetical protein
LFLLSGHDDGRGVFENMGVLAEGRSQLFSFATVVAIINSVIGGSAVAIAAGVLGAPLGVAAAGGAVVAIVSVLAWVRLAARLLSRRTSGIEPMFPSP